MDGILEHATNIIQAAKQPKNKTREKKQQKCWCHYLFTRGLGFGKRRRRIACDGKRPQRVIIFPWLFFLSRDKTVRHGRYEIVRCTFVSTRRRKHQSPLLLSLFLLNRVKFKVFVVLFFYMAVVNFPRHPTVPCPKPFHKSLPISHRWRSDILPSNLYRVLIYVHIVPLPFGSCSSSPYFSPTQLLSLTDFGHRY